MSRVVALSCLFGLDGPPNARAAFNTDSVGTTSAEFLTLGADARATSMGSAGTASAEDATALYWNPAGLAELTERQVVLTHAVYLQSVFYNYIAYAQPIEALFASKRRRELKPSGLGTVAVGAVYLNAGGLTERDNTGVETGGKVTPQDLAALVGWGGQLSRDFEAGVAFKFINSRIQGSASTGAADFGLRWKWRFGVVPAWAAAAVRNLGAGLRFRGQEDPLPLSYHLGLGVRPHPTVLLTGEAAVPKSGPIFAAAGFEVELPVDRRLKAALRAGYSTRLKAADLDGFAGFSFGGGIAYTGLGLDYAWSPFGRLGQTHRMTVSYRF